MPNDELALNVLRTVEEVESQKSLAQRLGISVGKANYVLKALMEKGLVKAERFVHSRNKRAYFYVLTPKGVRTRMELTERFIEIKKREYEALLEERRTLENSLSSNYDKGQK